PDRRARRPVLRSSHELVLCGYAGKPAWHQEPAWLGDQLLVGPEDSAGAADIAAARLNDRAAGAVAALALREHRSDLVAVPALPGLHQLDQPDLAGMEPGPAGARMVSRGGRRAPPAA